jgi:uncharacterized protein (TIGR00369 family)
MTPSQSPTERQDIVRERTFRWSDPREFTSAGRGLTGRQLLEALAAGRIPAPPAVVLIGMQLIVVGDGHIEMALVPAEYMYNTIGCVHGGILTTLLDTAMGCSVLSSLDAKTGHTTLDVHVNFVRPATIDSGRLVAVGDVVHRGTRTATASGKVTDAEGRLYAHATTTCLLTSRAG